MATKIKNLSFLTLGLEFDFYFYDFVTHCFNIAAIGSEIKSVLKA